MSLNYAKGKPLGNNQVPFYDSPPAIPAIATTVKDSATTTSSILILTDNTTAIEVTGTGGPTYIKWLASATVDGSVAGTSVVATGATANFDHVVPAAQVRRFVVPVSLANNVQIGATITSMVGANVENRLFKHVAYRGAVTSIIAITEYGSSNSY